MPPRSDAVLPRLPRPQQALRTGNREATRTTELVAVDRATTRVASISSEGARTTVERVSVHVLVLVHRDRLPSTAEWQAELTALGLDLRIDAAIEVAEHAGFWPATLEGAPSGFEFYTGAVEEVFGDSPPAGTDGRTVVADFVTHSDMRELKCSMFAAAALASRANGVVFDEETEGTMDPQRLLAQASGIEL